MPLTLTQLTGLVPYFTDKAQAQKASFVNAATLIKRDARTLLTVKCNYAFGLDEAGVALVDPEAANDLIGIIRLKDGADVNWHNAEILVDDDADTFTCQLGFLNADGTFTAKATMGAAVDNLSVAVVPGPAEELLTEPKWVVAKIIGTPPTEGNATFYIPYIAVA